MSRFARLAPAVVVALGAAAATAHGLYEVAVASRVPDGIAWLYPVITDGLALVAYSATSRLVGPAARYAWACVVLAAALSGLAQAVYLAAATVQAAPVLRFGVGAWPAVACALVAHLLHLMATTDRELAAVAGSAEHGAAPTASATLPVDPARVVPLARLLPVFPSPPALLPSPPVEEEAGGPTGKQGEEPAGEEVDDEPVAPPQTGHKLNDARAWFLHERENGRTPLPVDVNRWIGSEGYVKTRHLEQWEQDLAVGADPETGPIPRLTLAR